MTALALSNRYEILRRRESNAESSESNASQHMKKVKDLSILPIIDVNERDVFEHQMVKDPGFRAVMVNEYFIFSTFNSLKCISFYQIEKMKVKKKDVRKTVFNIMDTVVALDYGRNFTFEGKTGKENFSETKLCGHIQGNFLFQIFESIFTGHVRQPYVLSIWNAVAVQDLFPGATDIDGSIADWLTAAKDKRKDGTAKKQRQQKERQREALQSVSDRSSE